jgi:hypothetical protein
VFRATGRVRDPHGVARAIGIAQEERSVVVHFPARDDVPDVRAQAFKVKAGDVSAQVMGVGPDVNQDHRTADAGRIKPPPGRHVLRGKIPLNVLKVKLTDRPNCPCADHGPGLSHHRVTRVTVREAELGACPEG